MIIELNREDIEKAIRNYVKDEILGYSKKDQFNIEITQAKTAKATIKLVANVTDISEQFLAAEWTFLGAGISKDPVPEDIFGFIYLITFDDGMKYVGKKQIFMKRRLQPRKTDRKNAKRIVYREDKHWRSYEGSSDFKGDRVVATKEILTICFSKKELTYEEERELFSRDVLRDDNYLNYSIRNVYFKHDFEL